MLHYRHQLQRVVAVGLYARQHVLFKLGIRAYAGAFFGHAYVRLVYRQLGYFGRGIAPRAPLVCAFPHHASKGVVWILNDLIYIGWNNVAHKSVLEAHMQLYPLADFKRVLGQHFFPHAAAQ